MIYSISSLTRCCTLVWYH